MKKSRHYMALKSAFTTQWYKLDRVQTRLRAWPHMWLRDALGDRPCIELCPQVPEFSTVLINLGKMRITEDSECYPAYMTVFNERRRTYRSKGRDEMLAGGDEDNMQARIDDVEVFRMALDHWLIHIGPKAYGRSPQALKQAAMFGARALAEFNAEKMRRLEQDNKEYERSITYIFLTLEEHKRVNAAEPDLIRELQSYDHIWSSTGIEFQKVPAPLADRAKELAIKTRKVREHNDKYKT